MKKSSKNKYWARNIRRVLIIMAMFLMTVQCARFFMTEEKKQENYTKMINLAFEYERDGDFKNAEKFYKRAARYDNFAYYEWAMMYYQNIDSEKGLKKLEEAYNKYKIVLAARTLGNIKYAKKDMKNAKKWFIKGAEGEDVESQYYLALILEEEKNINEAEKWYKKAAEQEDSAAIYKLIYINFFKGNRDQMIKWRKELFETKGIEKISWDMKENIDHMFGNEQEQQYFRLAVDGEKYQDESRYKDAENRYIEAANIYNGAYVDLGLFYYYGIGDKEKGKEILNEAYKKGIKGADFRLGVIAYAEKHKDEANKWYNISAEKGNPRAQFYIALDYDKKKEFKKAEKFYLLSAEQKDAEAMYNLMLMYLNDMKDKKNAKKWANSILEEAGLINLTLNIKNAAKDTLTEVDEKI